ncbi:MAG: polyprenol monophosphomannose synthase [Acidimicrobiia bacterium]|nr:polyprenol monophosphomannose synthase [Acidimicrobiia bacterium]
MRLDPVTVVVPTYNERQNLPDLVTAVLSHGYRLLIVDDGSPDGTGTLADELASQHTLMDVVHRSTKQGLGPAYAEGFAVALEGGAAVVCEMDADFSHDPNDLPRLIGALEGGADLALGSRYVPGGSTPDWPWHRRFLSRGGNLYARIALGLSTHDATAGFRAYRADCLRRLHAETCGASGYAFQVELAMRAADEGCRIEEVPISFRDRKFGTSKMSNAIVAEAMWLVTRWAVSRRFGRLRSPG